MAEVELALQLHSGMSGALHGYTPHLLRDAKLVATPDDSVPTQILTPCLMVLFDAAFSTGQSHQSLNASWVTPVPKYSNATDTAKYRPPSVSEQAVCQNHGGAPCQVHRGAAAAVHHPDNLSARA